MGEVSDVVEEVGEQNPVDDHAAQQTEQGAGQSQQFGPGSKAETTHVMELQQLAV